MYGTMLAVPGESCAKIQEVKGGKAADGAYALTTKDGKDTFWLVFCFPSPGEQLLRDAA